MATVYMCNFMVLNIAYHLKQSRAIIITDLVLLYTPPVLSIYQWENLKVCHYNHLILIHYIGLYSTWKNIVSPFR